MLGFLSSLGMPVRIVQFLCMFAMMLTCLIAGCDAAYGGECFSQQLGVGCHSQQFRQKIVVQQVQPQAYYAQPFVQQQVVQHYVQPQRIIVQKQVQHHGRQQIILRQRVQRQQVQVQRQRIVTRSR